MWPHGPQMQRASWEGASELCRPRQFTHCEKALPGDDVKGVEAMVEGEWGTRFLAGMGEADSIQHSYLVSPFVFK